MTHIDLVVVKCMRFKLWRVTIILYVEVKHVFCENDYFSHYLPRLVSTKPWRLLRNIEMFLLRTCSSIIISIIIYIGIVIWENRSHLQRETVPGFQMTILVVKFKELFLSTENEFYKNEIFFCSSLDNIKKYPSFFT